MRKDTMAISFGGGLNRRAALEDAFLDGWTVNVGESQGTFRTHPLTGELITCGAIGTDAPTATFHRNDIVFSSKQEMLLNL